MNSTIKAFISRDYFNNVNKKEMIDDQIKEENKVTRALEDKRMLAG